MEDHHQCQLDRIIIKIRLRLLSLRWWHILIVHRHVAMWILITWMVHFFPHSWWLWRRIRSRCWLIREIQSNICPPASNRTFRLIPENNHGPTACLHILETRKELKNT